MSMFGCVRSFVCLIVYSFVRLVVCWCVCLCVCLFDGLFACLLICLCVACLVVYECGCLVGLLWRGCFFVRWFVLVVCLCMLLSWFVCLVD